MNVCTDQLLLTLADPEQILGLSRFSRDGWQSQAGDISRYPVLSGGAEDVLLIRPDIVVASAFDKRSTRELLKAKGLRLVELSVPRTLDEARQQIREAGDITGHPDRAAAEIARLDAALARARRAVSERHYRVLPLSRRGWVAGSDSFVGSLLGETGLRSAAGDLGFAFGGFASLEAIVNLRPDFIVVSQAGDTATGRRPGVPVASGAGALLSAGKAHRDSGTHDRMRRRAAGGCARRADGGGEAGGEVRSGHKYLVVPANAGTHNHRTL